MSNLINWLVERIGGAGDILGGAAVILLALSSFCGPRAVRRWVTWGRPMAVVNVPRS